MSDAVRRRLDAIWERNRGEVDRRLDAVDAGVAAGAAPEARAEGVWAAHKLVGTLGTFGVHEGSRLAADLEHLLATPATDPAREADLARRLRAVVGAR